MAQSAFAKAFVNKAKKTFNDAKKYKHREGNSFGPVDVPDGSFSAVVTAETSVPTKGKMEGVPVVRFKAAINSGQHEGKEPSQSYFCEGKPIPTDPEDFPTAEQQVLGLLQWLLPDVDISEVEQVPDAIDLLNKRGPICVIGIRNTEKDGKKYQNVYFNKLVKAVSFEQADEPADEGSDDTSSDDSGADDYVPAKDDIVTIDGQDGEWEVTAVSQSNQTANLKSSDGSARMNKIAWRDLTLV